MKNTFTFLLVSIITISLVGQSNFYPTNNLKSTQVIKHRMDSTVYEVYYEEDDEWYLNYKQDFIYDENLNMIESRWYYWRNNLWEFTDLTEFTYDENGLITLRLESYWDDNSAEIVINYKEEYTYTGNQQLALMIETNWNTNVNEWELTYKKAYTYNDFWEISVINDYHWEDDTQEWINGDSIVYNYDVNDFIELVLVYEWDNDISEWKENTKKEYICDDNGNIISQTISFMNNNTLEWGLYEKREYDYDANNNPIVEIEFEWDDSKSWYEEVKYEYSYNLNYDLSDMILPPLFYYEPEHFDNISNMLIDYNKYYFSGDWYVENKATYYYSEHEVTGIADHSESSVEVFPNPTSGIINLHLETEFQQLSFELIDVQGKRVIQQEISNSKIIDVDQFKSGLYFYNIYGNSKSLQSGKIIIQ